MENSILTLCPGKGNSDCQADDHGDQKCQPVPLPVNNRGNSRQEHKSCLEIKDPAKNVRYHGIIHVQTPLLRKNVIDVTKTSVGGNNYYAVTDFQGIVASWNTDSAISVKAANQKILLQVQFLQSLAHNRRMIADLKLQGFCLAIQNVVQGLHIASDGVLGCSHILQNVMCRIPEGTQSGSKIRLRGKGIQVMGKAGVYGDLYVTIQVQVPRNLSEESKRKLHEFDASTRMTGARNSRTA